jgi:DNA repair photolyase
MSYNVLKTYFIDPSIPLLNDSNSESILRERVKNITDAVEDWSKFTFLYMKYIGENYMNKFIELFFQNITSINEGGFNDEDFFSSMKFGFRALISRYLSLMKTGALMHLDEVNKTNIMDNEELGENGLKIVYVIRPWFKILNEELQKTLDNIFDKMISLCIGLFIGFIIFAVVIYVLVWKNVEFKLEKYLLNSIDLINLIPEKIKLDLYNKMMEEHEI